MIRNLLAFFGIKNAGFYRELVWQKRGKTAYLRITKPTFFKYIREGRIRAIKAGKGWKVLKSELDRFLRGDW